MTYKSTEKKSLWWRMFACVIAAAMALSLVPAAGMSVAFAAADDGYELSPEPCFDDVNPGIDGVDGDWFHYAVHSAKDLGLVEGYAGTRNFGPNNHITRAQVVTILWRLAGKPAATGTKKCNDVKMGSYYYKAVMWGLNAGVCNGYASGNFGPNNHITREDLTVMITNYASKVAGMVIAYEKQEALINSLIEWGLADYQDVSSYALNSIVWCFNYEIMGGTEEGLIKPKDKATRAEVAAMVVHLYDLFTYMDVVE